MLIYLLKVSACLAVFLIFYKLFLENLAIHKFKRIFLLSVLFISIIIPFITFTKYLEPVYDFETYNPSFLQTPPFFPAEIVTDKQETVDYLPIILWSIYGLGVFIFSVKFIVNLKNIYNRIQQNQKQKSGLFTHVLLQNLIIPHTFFNYIFLNKTLFVTKQIPQEVFWHEESHAKQKHSIDVLLLEIMQVIFWFNPLIYIIKNAVKLNHEFLADQAVINKGCSISTYQEILLAFSFNIQEPQLANAINYSSIKKRFTLMKAQTKKQTLWFRSLLLIPLLAFLIYGFSSTEIEYLEKTPLLLSQKSEAKIINDSITEENDVKAKYYKNVTFKFRDKNKNIVATKSYNELSKEEKANLYMPTKPIKKLPTRAEFKSWKNDKKFAIWIDDKYVLNTTLNNYKAEDIIYYNGSFVHKNARSEKFPQPNQYHLFTNKSYDKLFTDEIKPLSKNAEIFITSSSFNKTSEKDSTDFKIRKLLLMVSKKQRKPITYLLNDISSNAEEILTFIKKHPKSNVTFKKDKENIVHFFDNDGLPMTHDELQEVYTLLFENYIQSPKTIIVDKIQASKKSPFTKTIKPVNIDVKKDSSLLLNGRLVKRSQIINKIQKINAHLSKKEQSEYVNVSFIIPNQSYSSFVKKVQIELRTIGIYGTSVSYKSGLKQSKLPMKHFGFYNNLTLEEAKVRKDSVSSGKYEEKFKDQKNKKDSPWEISEVKIESVEFIPDSNQSKVLTKVNGNECDNCTLPLSKEEIENLILTTNISESVKSFNIKFPGKSTVNVLGKKLNNKAIQYLNESSLEETITIFFVKTANNNKSSNVFINVSDFKEDNIPPPPIPKDATPEQKIKYQKIIDDYKKRNRK